MYALIKFKEYTDNFDINDDNINIKYYHSLRVRENSEEIAKSLKFGKYDIDLAKFIGLTHDIGRFSQWKLYGTFDDSKSMDHALLSINILFREKFLTNFPSLTKDANVIKMAIYNHNKYLIDKKLSERELLFAKIIRDADKLDLLYLLGENAIILDEDDSVVTDVVNNTFLDCKAINTADCRSLSDKILFKMAFVFDLNFTKSFEIIKRKKLLDNFYNNLQFKNRYKKYYLYAKKYIESKLQEI